MWHFLFPLLLTLSCSLFADNDWDDESCSSYECFVTYGGMEIQCNVGCGDPRYDRNADKIAYLCSEWLQRPLYPNASISKNSWEYAEDLDLTPWEYGKITDIEGYDYFEDCEDEGLSHGEFLLASSKFLAEIDILTLDYQRDIQQHTLNLQIIRELEKDGARFIEIEEDGEIEGYGRSTFNSITVKRALESEQGSIKYCQRSLDRYD